MNENIVFTFLNGNKPEDQQNNDYVESRPFSIISSQLKSKNISFPVWERPDLRNDIKKYKKDQVEMTCTNQKVERNTKKFEIKRFKRKEPELISTPHFTVIKPFALKTKIGANTLSVSLDQYPTFLRPSFNINSNTSKNPNSNPITLKKKFNTSDLNDNVSYLFQSILMSSKPIDEGDDDFTQDYYDIDLKQEVQKTSINMLPPLVNTPIYDYEIVEFEMDKIKKEKLKINRYIPYTPNEITEEMIVSKGKPNGAKKSIYNIGDLSLSSGEFIVIESIDENPIIQPMVVMTSQLNILINGESKTQNKYDERIPVINVTSDNSNYFLSPIPKDRYILMYLNTVVNSALAQHKSNETDFILTIGRNVKLYKFPNNTYLSTVYEPRVIIPAPVRKDPHCPLKEFEKPDLPTPEYLCKQRSIYKGLSFLRSKGIMTRNKVPNIPKNASDQINKLPQEMKIMIKKYIDYLKSTPWHKSLAYAKGRIGNFRSISSIQQTDQTKNDALLKELQTCFENNLLFIESDGDTNQQNDLDSIDLDLNLDLLMNYEEEEECEILLNIDEKEEDEKAFTQRNDLHKTRIDWKKYNLNDFPKRPLLKIIETKYQDNKVISSLHWIRDPNIIANAKKRGMVSHLSFDEIYNKNETKQINEQEDSSSYYYSSSTEE